MCQFFSFSVDKGGHVYALLAEEREIAIIEGENPDSHSYISEYFDIQEDDTWKFEIPLDKADIDELCRGGVPDKLKIEDINHLRRWYDGGLPINDMPLTIAEYVIWWICDHLDEIKEAGILKFSSPLGEQILDSNGMEVITLSIARTRDQLALELARAINQKLQVYHEENWLKKQLLSSYGFMYEFPRKSGEPIKRFRVRMLQFNPDYTYMRIFVNRYEGAFVSRPPDGPPVAGIEDRIFIYPVLSMRKEGESK